MANEYMCKRPKVDDDDEELLHQQEEFLKLNQQPSAKLINLEHSGNVQSRNAISHGVKRDISKIKSRFSSLRKFGLKQEIISTSRTSGKLINPAIEDKIKKTLEEKPEDVVQNIPIASNIIIGNVVEKKLDIKKYNFHKNSIFTTNDTGFPEVFGFDDMKTNAEQSIFWQKITERKMDDSMKVQRTEFTYSNKEDGSVLMESQWANEIHNENLKKLAEMSEEEILEEKKRLEKILDPNIIQFLRNKKRKADKRSMEQHSAQDSVALANMTEMDIEVSNDKKIKLSLDDKDGIAMDCENDSSNIPKPLQDILQESKQKGWVHMDIPEPEKSKWMEDLPVDKKNEPEPTEWYNARFDFNGLLLPYKDESLTVDKGLHHHGEEPERPGYSLQELLQLSRSSTQQQRCTALTTLANIMEKTRKGWYDKALHPAPLTALSEKNILLLLRFSLDDTSIAVVTAALQALRAFLYSEADEACLDRLYGFNEYVEPVLTPEFEDKDTSSLKDHELAQLDTVATLLRTDFLLRIRYILSEMHPSPIGVTCALEILIRLARHSYITALNIASSPNLLDTIIDNFMPISMSRSGTQDAINDVYGVPLVKAVKLCRILITYGKEPVVQKLNKLILPIITYVTGKTGSLEKDDIHLSIESLRLWRVLLRYEVAINNISNSQLTLINQLLSLLHNHDLQNASELACERAAALIAVVGHGNILKSEMSLLMVKWSTQLSLIEKPTWGVMKLMSEILSAVDDISEFKTDLLSNHNIFLKLRSSSNLLSDCSLVTAREPSCLPNLNVLLENGELQPIVSLHSSALFLTTILTKFYNNSYVAEIQSIFEQSSFCKYIQDVDITEWNLERSWYSRTELFFLMAVVKAASILGDKMNNAMAQSVWRIAIKLISALPADTPHYISDLLKITMSKEKINLEIITNELAKLNLTAATDQVKIDLCSNAALLYQKYIIPNGDWNQAAMPKDWLFLPLVDVYTKSKNNITLQTKDKDNILIVLSLIMILPDLMKKLSPTLKFSRLILAYLCDTMYLDKDVSLLLANVMSIFLRRYHMKLDFKIDLPGLSSFIDLFTALCEHFCSSSYGNDGFAMVLLIPIAQCHDVHYRKLLWSEHAGALRYLRLPMDRLMVPLRDYFYPEEEDMSLIESYITTLVRGIIRETWCPIPYAIAIHHSAMYLKRSNNLAIRMKRQVEKLQNKNLASKLLQYEPPQL